MQILVIASFLAIYIYDGIEKPLLYNGRAESLSAPVLLFALAALTGISWALSHLSAKRLDRGGVSAFTWNEIALLVLQIAACAVFYFAVLGLGWLEFVRRSVGDLILVDELLALLPLLLFACLLWWGAYPVERRWHDALFSRWLYTGRPLFMPPKRWEFVVSKVRHTILFFAVPMSILMAWKEFCHMKLAWLLGIATPDGRPLPDLSEWQMLLPVTIMMCGIAVILTLVPLVLVVVLDTVPLGQGTLRDRLIGLCRQHGVGLRNLLVWRTHGTMANGAAMGIIRPVRYILLSDQLLESLPVPQVEAVMAHEVAHIRHRHIFWLGLTVLGTLMLTGGAFGAAAHHVWRSESQAVDEFIALVSLLCVFIAFGWVSRRFEWQADAFAVRHMAGTLPTAEEIGDGESGSHASIVTPVAVAAMSDALAGVAELNGINPKRLSFRHGSIFTRQIRIRDLVGMPRSEFPIDVICRRIKVAACIALVAGIGLSVLDAYLSTGAKPDDNTKPWVSLNTNNDSAK